MSYMDDRVRELKRLAESKHWFGSRHKDDRDLILLRNRFTYDFDAQRDPLKFGSITPRESGVKPTTDPIYRALSKRARFEIQTRMLHLEEARSGEEEVFFNGVLRTFRTEARDGVSIDTVSALLTPEPYYLWLRHQFSPVLVVPEPISFRPKGKLRFVRRETQPWHVFLWAVKRNLMISWAQLAELHPAMNRPAESLRQTLRRMVEEPLACFYRDLTGKEMDTALYSAALGDSPTEEPLSRGRMRELKRLASSLRSPIPKN